MVTPYSQLMFKKLSWAKCLTREKMYAERCTLFWVTATPDSKGYMIKGKVIRLSNSYESSKVTHPIETLVIVYTRKGTNIDEMSRFSSAILE